MAKIARRGIVGEAISESAEKSITNRVVEGCFVVGVTLTCTILAIGLAGAGQSGAGAIGILALMGWMATIADEGTIYFLSWLTNDKDVVYA